MTDPRPPAEDHRIRVSTPTRVVTADGERAVTIVALSARTALLLAAEPLGAVGRVIDLVVPALGRSELVITAGIERVERVREGHAVTVHFIIAEQPLRRALNELLALLLDGAGGGSRRHARVLYDVRVRLGDDADGRGRLEELSLAGASVRLGTVLAAGAPLVLHVPEIWGAASLRLVGRVVGQRPALDGGWHTGVAFDALDADTRAALSRLLADLMCR